MSICDKRTLQPGGEEPCDDSTLRPPGTDPPEGPPDNEDPFFPPPPPEAGNCNIDSDCPQGYICLEGICVPDPKLPGGPNTPILGCSVDSDCPPGWSCREGVCIPPVDPGEGNNPGGPTDPEVPTDPGGSGDGNQPPFPDGPGGSNSNGCANEFVCLLEPPVPSLMINPIEEVYGGETLGTDGEGPLYKVPLEVCKDEELLQNIPLDPVRCYIDEDCPEGFVCVDGLCVAEECEPACQEILEEGKGADEFVELREKEYDPEKGWEVTDREQEPYEQGSPYPFSGTLGKGKEYFDHSVNCQAQNGQELWNINDGISHTDCFLPDKYAKVKWEPRRYVFCRRVDCCDTLQVWKDLLIGDLYDPSFGNTPKREQVSGRLFVRNATTLYDSLSVGRWTHIEGRLNVKNNTTLQSSLTVSGNTTLRDTSTDNLTVDKDLRVLGHATFRNASIFGLTIGRNLSSPEMTVDGKTLKPTTIRVVTDITVSGSGENLEVTPVYSTFDVWTY